MSSQYIFTVLDRVFPSMYDMFVGGVSSSGESSLQTLLRELNEEVGLDFTLFSSTIDCSDNQNKKTDNTNNKIKSETIPGPYSNTVGEGKMFPDNDALQKFLTASDMTQKLKKSILMSGEDKQEEIENPIISSDNRISYLGRTIIETTYNHCIVDCYAAVCDDKYANMITFPDGEIEWGEWMTMESLNLLLKDKNKIFVPDGLQVWNALPSFVNN